MASIALFEVRVNGVELFLVLWWDLVLLAAKTHALGTFKLDVVQVGLPQLTRRQSTVVDQATLLSELNGACVVSNAVA